MWPAMLARAGVALQILFAVMATLSIRTYWHDPDYSGIPPASISPAHLVDYSRLYLRPTHGNLDVDRAVAADGWLVIPPSTVAIDSPSDVIVLTGTAARPAGTSLPEPPMVRVYGFTTERWGEAVRRSDLRDFLEGRWRAAGDEDPVARRARQVGVNLTRSSVRVGSSWDAVLLGEQVVPSSGEVNLRLGVPPGVRAIAVTCNWSVAGQEASPFPSSERRVCLRIRVLAAAVEDGDYFDPRPVPPALRTRLPFGTSVIDARELPPGHYLLPSMRYSFLRVRTEHGEIVPTYEYDGLPVVRHPAACNRTSSPTISPPSFWRWWPECRSSASTSW